MTCDACAIAAVDARTGRFNAGCDDCAARSLAGSPEFFESVTAGARTTAYRAALETRFGDRWADMHTRVRAWYDTLKGTK